MRTTVELSDEHRAALQAIAARRGLRGFSRVVQEAIDFYLRHHEAGAEARGELKKRRGAWTAEEAEELRRAIAELRRWLDS